MNTQLRLCKKRSLRTTRPGTSKAAGLHRGILFALVAAAAILLQYSASAASATWTGATDGNWNTTTNWSGGVVPVVPGVSAATATADTAYFNGNVNTAINLATPGSVNNMEFQVGAGAFTFSGSALSFPRYGRVTIDAGVTADQTFNNTLDTANYFGPWMVDNGSGGFIINGAVTPSSAQGIVLAGDGTGANVINGVISGAGYASYGFSKAGLSTWTLTAHNTFTGYMGLQGGTLKLDFAAAGAPTSDIVSASLILSPQAGSQPNFDASVNSVSAASSQTLLLAGKAGVANSQSFSALGSGGVPPSGALHINLTAGGSGGTMVVNLGSLYGNSKNAGFALDLSLPAGTSATCTNFVGVNGGLEADRSFQSFVTINATDFAGVDLSGNIVPVAYSNSTSNTLPGGLYVDMVADTTIAGAGSPSVEGLRFNDGTARSITMGSGTLTVNDGILVTSNVGNNLVSITGGTIQGESGRDLTISQNNLSNVLQIDSVLGNAATYGFTKVGRGELVLTNANTYTGVTMLDEGTTTITGAGGLGVGTGHGGFGVGHGVNIAAGATLQIGNGGSAGSLTAGQTVDSDGTVIFNRNNALAFSNIIAGKGTVRQVGSGQTTIGGVQTYTGATYVSAGTMLVSGSLSATSSLVISGGTLELGAANVINSAASLTISGGTFSTGATTGYSQTLGTLSLSTASTLTLNLGTGVHSLNFADSSLIDWTGSTLTINGWTGTAGLSGTAGQIFFGNSSAGLTADQLSRIYFTGYGAGAAILGNGEIVAVAVPEPTTMALMALSLTAGMVLYRRRNS